jgi:hypothetical protein
VNANVLNDGWTRLPGGWPSGEVTAGQFLPRLATDAEGSLTVVWYDTRRDPADRRLDVFGTRSTDGGQTFSPNFRLTSVTFDPDAGKFTDAAGGDDYYLGDSLGLAMANSTAYAAWTDTRNGNQDIYFTRYRLDPAPAAFNDRFEPNQTAAATTSAGWSHRPPKLAIAAGGTGSVQAAVTGSLTVTATLPFADSRLELYDASGLLATGPRCRAPVVRSPGRRSTSLAIPARPIWCGSCPAPRLPTARRLATRWACAP